MQNFNHELEHASREFKDSVVGLWKIGYDQGLDTWAFQTLEGVKLSGIINRQGVLITSAQVASEEELAKTTCEQIKKEFMKMPFESFDALFDTCSPLHRKRFANDLSRKLSSIQS